MYVDEHTIDWGRTRGFDDLFFVVVYGYVHKGQGLKVRMKKIFSKFDYNTIEEAEKVMLDQKSRFKIDEIHCHKHV